jgi:hypothetical protein
MSDDADSLAFLLDLNLARAGKKITSLRLPLPLNEQTKFVTEDCVERHSHTNP